MKLMSQNFQILPEQKKQLLIFSEYSDTALIFLSLDLLINDFNNVAKKIFHWKKKEIFNKSFPEWCKKNKIDCPLPKIDKTEILKILPITGIETTINDKHHLLWNVICNHDVNNKAQEIILIGKERTLQDISSHKLEQLTLEQKSIYSDLSSMSKSIIGYDLGINRPATDYLAQVSSYLEGIISHLPCYVYWKNKDFIYLGCNDLTARLLRLNSRKDIVGMTDYDFGWNIKDVDNYRKVDTEIIRSGKPVLNLEEKIAIEKQYEIDLLVNKMPLFDADGKIIGLVGVSVDITEIKKTQKELIEAKNAAEAASRAKSMFLANMSHDVKTPITGIISTAEYLMHVLQDEEYKIRADDIVQSGIRLLDLMIELIEISRLEFQETTNNKTRFNFNQVIKEIIQLIKPAISDKELDLEQKFDARIPAYLVGNRWHLSRILLNLVSNAIKFTNAGKITINTKLIKKKKKEIIIQLGVQDTGIGIPKGKEEVIFEQFSRLTPSYQGIYKGSGLGLYIVKQFVESMQGKIYVESEEGKGSNFICVVPFEISSVQEDEEDENKITSETQSTSKYKNHISKVHGQVKPAVVKKSINIAEYPIRVLLVEDNEIAARAAKTNLEVLGCTVEHAINGNEAIKLFEQKEFDLIFMDLGLPDINGTEVTIKIREKESFSRSIKIPIIALSAHIDEAIKSSCLKSGMTETLTKPLLIDQAKTILEQVQHMKTSADHQKALENKKTQTKTSIEQNEAEYKVIDLEFGASIIGSDINEAKNILAAVIDSFPETQKEMDKFYQEKDFKSLEKTVHKLHGGVAYTGAIKLQKALRILVDTIRMNKPDEYEALYKNACNAMEELVSAFKKL